MQLLVARAVRDVVPAYCNIGIHFDPLLTDLGALALGLAAYGAVFAFVGARLKRPLLVGLLFVLGWEWGLRALGVPKYFIPTLSEIWSATAPRQRPR